MTKTKSRKSAPVIPDIHGTAVSDIARRAFGNNLQTIMREKNLNPSDVARAAWGEEEGTGTARNRHLLSKYLSGKAFPSHDNLVILMEVLDVKPSVLLPASILGMINQRLVTSTYETDKKDDGYMFVTIMKRMKTSYAKQIMILEKQSDLETLQEEVGIVSHKKA